MTRQARGWAAMPSAERILATFADLTRHELRQHGQHVQSVEAELNPLQQQVLDLSASPPVATPPEGRTPDTAPV